MPHGLGLAGFLWSRSLPRLHLHHLVKERTVGAAAATERPVFLGDPMGQQTRQTALVPSLLPVAAS